MQLLVKPPIPDHDPEPSLPDPGPDVTKVDASDSKEKGDTPPKRFPLSEANIGQVSLKNIHSHIVDGSIDTKPFWR